ncbi:MAG: MFS transporter [Deltaproteobacteria bacterium]|jgi:nitrate/nitrite transporter NarK|nr:MFS transporter [Deltaproteobacteria bacterium]
MSPNVKRYFALFALAMGSGASSTLPYIKFIFYDAWVEGLALPVAQHESAGILLTFHMIGCTLLYIPGGYIADKFSPKKILMVSLCGTALLNIWYSFDPSYSTGRIIWFLLAFTVGFAYWSSLIKAVRMLGTPQEQGKMFGWFNAGEGALSGTCLGIATWVFSLYVLSSAALQHAVWVQAGFCLLSALMILIFFDEEMCRKNAGNSDDEIFKLRDVGKVLSNPWVWCVAVVCMCCYGSYTGQSYLTPYMTQVLQVSATVGALLGILRTRVARFAGGGLGGIMADKLGSACKMIILSNLVVIALLGIFFLFPGISDSPILAISLSLIVAVTNFMGYAIMFAAMEEAHIPRYLTGTAVGIISILGYSPDGFINALFGHWLDIHGDGGYTYIFGFLIAMCVVGSLACYLIMQRHKRLTK